MSIYDRGETGEGQLWIAMQFVDGTDADKAVRSGIMSPARAVHILGHAAKALDYAHQRGVVHRDIKPANLLLSGAAGPDERVLLGDFGIARALGDAGLTVTGSLLATLPYAAPEVLAGGLADARADLYSLGCTLFRMLTGHEPFAADSGMAALVAAHLYAPPPKVTDRLPRLSARMDAAIATAMAKNPAERFSSARHLAAVAAEALTDAGCRQLLRGNRSKVSPGPTHHRRNPVPALGTPRRYTHDDAPAPTWLPYVATGTRPFAPPACQTGTPAQDRRLDRRHAGDSRHGRRRDNADRAIPCTTRHSPVGRNHAGIEHSPIWLVSRHHGDRSSTTAANCGANRIPAVRAGDRHDLRRPHDDRAKHL